jgi:hypothetical protein
VNLGPTRSAGALLSAAVLVLGSAAASSAAVWDHTDPSGDVRVVTDSSSGPTVGPADPTIATPDITHVRVAHNKGAVVVKTTLLNPLPSDGWEVASRIRTPTGRYLLVHARQHQHTLNLLIDPHAYQVRCRGLEVVVGTPRTHETTTVPRSCLKTPAWVRVGVELCTFDDAPASSDTYTDEADDANSASLRTAGPALSPKVFAPKG